MSSGRWYEKSLASSVLTFPMAASIASDSGTGWGSAGTLPRGPESASDFTRGRGISSIGPSAVPISTNRSAESADRHDARPR